MLTKKKNKRAESGNAFFIVMISVVLFAALMFTFSRGARQGGDNLSSRQAGIAASDILDYTQKVERAVGRVYSKQFSENDISFENSFVSGYANPNCGVGQDRCKVFMPQGGGMFYKDISENWLNNSFQATYTGHASKQWGEWVFDGANTIDSVGTTCGTQSCKDLSMWLHFVKKDICIAINERLGITNPSGEPPPERIAAPPGTIPTDKFTGVFLNAARGVDNGVPGGAGTACLTVEGDTSDKYYIFYHVLLER